MASKQYAALLYKEVVKVKQNWQIQLVKAITTLNTTNGIIQCVTITAIWDVDERSQNADYQICILSSTAFSHDQALDSCD